MSGLGKRQFFTFFLAALPACSLFVSLDDLQDGGSGGSDASTGDGALDVITANDTGADSSSSLDAGTDAESGVFLDDFNRADSPSIGNGWTMKMPAAFTLSSNQVQRTTDMTTNFSDDIVYRPADEDVADVDLSVEVVFQGTPGGYPQLHVRAQRATITQAGFLDSYICYIEAADTLAISRTYDFTNLEDFPTGTIAPPVVTGDRYRLHCSVRGTNPPVIDASLEHFSGGTWTTVAQTQAQDADAGVMSGAGTVGFSASSTDSSQYVYDNFIRTNL